MDDGGKAHKHTHGKPKFRMEPGTPVKQWANQNQNRWLRPAECIDKVLICNQRHPTKVTREVTRHSDMQHGLREILHGVEKAHKADILTYSSGHLGPHSVAAGPLRCSTRKPARNVAECKDKEHVKISGRKIASVGETGDALDTTTPEEIQERPAGLREEFLTTEPMKVQHVTRLTKTERCTASDTVARGSRADTGIVRTKDSTARKCLSGGDAATRHENKLQQALRKLPGGEGPCRERLGVFSDVFDDVCDASAAFGSVLRDIKIEYDLYLKSLLSSQSPLQDKSLPTSFGAFAGAPEVQEAAREVLLLEQEAGRALEENNRVRIKREDARAKASVDQKENESRQPADRCNEGMSPEVTERKVSFTAQVEALTQQVWKVWNEVQKLEKDIRETMVSNVTTSALQACIRDTEDEILNFAASSVFLQRSNKDLERNISSILSKAKVDEETSGQVWEEIWTTLDGSHREDLITTLLDQ